MRPAFWQLGKRLAEAGYGVLVINPSYRTKKSPVATSDCTTPIQEVSPLARTLNSKTHPDDANAFIAWLDAQAQIDNKKKIGTIGYCMGGPMVMGTAAAEPDRVGAAWMVPT